MHKACIAHTTTQEVSVIRLSISSENYHILYRGLRKHFQICSSTGVKPIDTTNIEIIFAKRTTLTGALHRIKKKITSRCAQEVIK